MAGMLALGRNSSLLFASFSFQIVVHEAPEVQTDHAQWKDLDAEGEDSEGLLEMSSDEDAYTDEED